MLSPMWLTIFFAALPMKSWRDVVLLTVFEMAPFLDVMIWIEVLKDKSYPRWQSDVKRDDGQTGEIQER